MTYDGDGNGDAGDSGDAMSVSAGNATGEDGERPGDFNRLRRMLDTADLGWLLARMRTRLESTGQLSGTVTKPNATSAERTAAARLIGRPVRAGLSASISLDALDATLRRSGAWPDGLASAVVALTGSVIAPSARTAERDAWLAVNNSLRALATELDRDELVIWAERLIRTGALKRSATSVEHAQALSNQLIRIAHALPSTGESLGVFSARVAGNAHALDAQTALGSLAIGLAAALGGVRGNSSVTGDGIAVVGSRGDITDTADIAGKIVEPATSDANGEGAVFATSDADAESAASGARGATTSNGTATPSGSARWRRDAWQSVGIVVDELSSTVLTLGLPGGLTSPTARSLTELARAGQPVILTLRQLMADATGHAPRLVFVCENPAVVAAVADQLGAGSAPLVCLNGQPGAAAIKLLQELVRGGSALRYHGDFDWGGMAIARTLARHVPWEPWRFSASDYEQAHASLAATTILPTLTGTPGETPWDSALADAMVRASLKIEEELLIDTLIEDLGR